MDNEKNIDFEDAGKSEENEFQSGTASRARNRTVMLTPEITGEVRARLAQDLGHSVEPPAQTGPVNSGGIPRSPTPAGSYSANSVVPDAGDGFQRPTTNNYAAPQPAAAQQPKSVVPGEGVVWTKESPIVGFLVSYDKDPNGQVFELRNGRLIVTSEAPGTGNFIVLNDESVSPMHAILRISGDGNLQVLDQLSEFGTRIKRANSEEEEELSGDKSTLAHGDCIKFGNRSFYVCVVPRGDHE
ncbi:MAG: FHA domain-containing protein [Candidatus Dadabacteria bacterium]|nr:MAG: FHA domain-containing protein [Candidatus Dadabacteria bacterium]